VIGLAGFIVVACGAWFVFSPALWPTFGTGAVFEPARTAIGNFGNQFGYNLAVGVLLIALGGMAMKSSVPDRYPLVVIDEPMIDAEFVAVAADAANGAASVADVADVADVTDEAVISEPPLPVETKTPSPRRSPSAAKGKVRQPATKRTPNKTAGASPRKTAGPGRRRAGSQITDTFGSASD
jgi:hypothetical protein